MTLLSWLCKLTRYHQSPQCRNPSNPVEICKGTKVKYFVSTNYPFPIPLPSLSSSSFFSFSLGAGCICTMGVVDGGGGWGRAEHGNHLKVGWLLWRPTAAQWQQRELIELHRGGESCRAVESTEDYTHAVAHTYTQRSLTWYTCEDLLLAVLILWHGF